jgi:mRNA-degrading endonuclease toxin of MazEF toxin-antitoxin module
VAERGDVLRLRTRVGFGSDDEGSRVVVVQSSDLNAVLPTTVVIPLDAPTDADLRSPVVVQVAALEAGTAQDVVAYPTHLRVVPLDRFFPGRVGRLGVRTLAILRAKLRLVLDL